MSFSSSTNGSEASSGEAPSQALYDVGPGNESSFQETVEILWNGKGLILILALLLGAGAYVYWQHQPKTYQVSSVILLQEQKQIGALDLPFSEDPATKTSRALYYLRHSREIARTVAGRLVERIGPVETREATLLRASMQV